MASSVGGNLDYLATGPSKLTWNSFALGHTQGGVSVNVAVQQRERKVDEFGENVVDLVHTGDKIEIKTSLPERSMRTLTTVYKLNGTAFTSYEGLGKLPGTTGRSVAGPLVIHPLFMGAATTRDVTFYKTVPMPSGDVQMGSAGNDQVFQVTFMALVDDTKGDGLLFGRISEPRNVS